jgi:RNA polymerase sigma-70 factor (ECF subfamily)
VSAQPEEATTIHVRRSREGDAVSLAWLVERFTPLLLVQARYRLGRHLASLYDAEDLVQESWVAVLPRLSDLRPRDGRFTPVLLSFLGTALLNRYGTLMQKHVQGKPLRSGPPGSGGSSGTNPVARLSADQTSVLSQAARGEVQARVLAELAGLPEKDREVLVLRSIEQVSLPTAALLLGLTENAVSARHRRALQRLRAALPGSIFDDLPSD